MSRAGLENDRVPGGGDRAGPGANRMESGNDRAGVDERPLGWLGVLMEGWQVAADKQAMLSCMACSSGMAWRDQKRQDQTAVWQLQELDQMVAWKPQKVEQTVAPVVAWQPQADDLIVKL